MIDAILIAVAVLGGVALPLYLFRQLVRKDESRVEEDRDQ